MSAAIEVHRVLGPGLLEQIYESALCVELGVSGFKFERQAEISVRYKDVPVGRGYVDVLVEQRIVVELKAVDVVHDIHVAQVISYLRAIRCRLGLLLNFNVLRLREGVRRIVLTTHREALPNQPNSAVSASSAAILSCL